LALPISVGLPLRHEEYLSHILFPFFANMLAEGGAKTIQCRALRIDENDLFTRLLKTTASNTIGSITIKELRDSEDKS
jgi:serine/threonine-protein kinase HipA